MPHADDTHVGMIGSYGSQGDRINQPCRDFWGSAYFYEIFTQVSGIVGNGFSDVLSV